MREPFEDWPNMSDLLPAVGAGGVVADLVEQRPVRIGQVGRELGRTLGDHVLGERVEREGLEREAEWVYGAGVGGVLPVEIQWSADQVQQVLHGGEMPHLLARDLREAVLQCIELRPIRVSDAYRVGGVEVLHH